MAQQAAPIAHDLMDEPHVAGRRVSVLQLYERVEEVGLDPHEVADQYDLDVAAVYYALAYYHANPEEMQQVREQRETSDGDRTTTRSYPTTSPVRGLLTVPSSTSTVCKPFSSTNTPPSRSLI